MLLLTAIFFNIYICVCKEMPLHCKCVGTDYQRCEFGSSWNALISTCLLKSKLCLWRAQEFLRITIWITITRLSTRRNTKTNEEQKWTSELESNKDFLPSYSSSDGAVKTSFVILNRITENPSIPLSEECLVGSDGWSSLSTFENASLATWTIKRGVRDTMGNLELRQQTREFDFWCPYELCFWLSVTVNYTL